MKILILPRFRFEEFLNDLEYQKKDTSNMFFISILDPCSVEPIRLESDNYKTWWFWDVDTKVGNYEPISTRQAKGIYDFINKHKDKEICVVHCSAGVSRSGAVGTFVNDFMNQDYNSFKSNNPYIMPNARIKMMLNRIHRENDN